MGGGPSTRQRHTARRAAHADGAWVREAAEAFAAKRAARRAAAAAE
jgi:ring-1,2-phenylacetyl-CoA epoxidase subunit PaaA